MTVSWEPTSASSGGVAVGNLCWAQSLPGTIGRELAIPTGLTGLLVVTVQIRDALGVFLLVPLGDTMHRRRMVPIMMLIPAVSMPICSGPAATPERSPVRQRERIRHPPHEGGAASWCVITDRTRRSDGQIFSVAPAES
ncbi:MAG: hypothetical protein H7288_12180 [Kineosporiaceae bacterium]|nr:hypothetical protein [Aeromicrobium sp.]